MKLFYRYIRFPSTEKIPEKNVPGRGRGPEKKSLQKSGSARQILDLPVDGRQAVFFQKGIAFAEVTAAEKAPVG